MQKLTGGSSAPKPKQSKSSSAAPAPFKSWFSANLEKVRALTLIHGYVMRTVDSQWCLTPTLPSWPQVLDLLSL